MAKSDFITDEEVEREIARLNASKAVKLAQKEVALKYQRRKRLYNLRCLERRGLELAESGITMNNIEKVLFSDLSEGDEV